MSGDTQDPKRSGAEIVKASADPVAAVLAGIVAIAGSTGLVARLGLTADDVAMICGYVLAAAAAIRSWGSRGGPPS